MVFNVYILADTLLVTIIVILQGMFFSQGAFEFLCQIEDTETSIMNVWNHTLYFMVVNSIWFTALLVKLHFSWAIGVIRDEIWLGQDFTKVQGKERHSIFISRCDSKGKPEPGQLSERGEGMGREGTHANIEDLGTSVRSAWGSDKESAWSCERIEMLYGCCHLQGSGREETGEKGCSKKKQSPAKWMEMMSNNISTIIVSLPQSMHYSQCFSYIISFIYRKDGLLIREKQWE